MLLPCRWRYKEVGNCASNGSDMGVLCRRRPRGGREGCGHLDVVCAVWWVLLALCVGVAAVSNEERDSLLQLYTETGGPYWTCGNDEVKECDVFSSSTQSVGWNGYQFSVSPNFVCNSSAYDYGVKPWSSHVDSCQWFGVACRSERVVAICLVDVNASGSMSRLTLAFPELAFFSMSINSITGTLPPSLSKLSKLRFLSLLGNQISGSLPASMSRLSQVEELWLGDNHFSGTLPPEWGSLPSVASIFVSDNPFLSGSLPREWGSLKSLQQLDVANCSFSGTLPEQWSDLANIVVMILRTNRFDGTLPESWSRLEKLESISVKNSSLKGALPKSWSSLSMLHKIDLSYNQFTGTLPKAWSKLTLLKSIRLNNNELIGNIPVEWSRFTQLEIFTVHTNNMTANASVPAMEVVKKWTSLHGFMFGCQWDRLHDIYPCNESLGFNSSVLKKLVSDNVNLALVDVRNETSHFNNSLVWSGGSYSSSRVQVIALISFGCAVFVLLFIIAGLWLAHSKGMAAVGPAHLLARCDLNRERLSPVGGVLYIIAIIASVDFVYVMSQSFAFNSQVETSSTSPYLESQASSRMNFSIAVQLLNGTVPVLRNVTDKWRSLQRDFFGQKPFETESLFQKGLHNGTYTFPVGWNTTGLQPTRIICLDVDLGSSGGITWGLSAGVGKVPGVEPGMSLPKQDFPYKLALNGSFTGSVLRRGMLMLEPLSLSSLGRDFQFNATLPFSDVSAYQVPNRRSVSNPTLFACLTHLDVHVSAVPLNVSVDGDPYSGTEVMRYQSFLFSGSDLGNSSTIREKFMCDSTHICFRIDRGSTMITRRVHRTVIIMDFLGSLSGALAGIFSGTESIICVVVALLAWRERRVAKKQKLEAKRIQDGETPLVILHSTPDLRGLNTSNYGSSDSERLQQCEESIQELRRRLLSVQVSS